MGVQVVPIANGDGEYRVMRLEFPESAGKDRHF